MMADFGPGRARPLYAGDWHWMFNENRRKTSKGLNRSLLMARFTTCDWIPMRRRHTHSAHTGVFDSGHLAVTWRSLIASGDCWYYLVVPNRVASVSEYVLTPRKGFTLTHPFIRHNSNLSRSKKHKKVSGSWHPETQTMATFVILSPFILPVYQCHETANFQVWRSASRLTSATQACANPS